MKKISIAALLLIASVAAMAQTNTFEGSGNVITRDVSIKSFDAIKAKGLYELILTQGSTPSVKVETDDNLQDLFVITNDGSTLVIDEPKLHDHSFNFKERKGEHEKTQHFKIYVTFTNIKSLDLQIIGGAHSEGTLTFDAFDLTSKSVGSVKLALTANKLTITSGGVGNIDLSGKAENVVLANSGVGQFNGENLVVQTMHVSNSGMGNANVNVVKDLTIKKSSFLGKVQNSGSAKTRTMDGQEI